MTPTEFVTTLVREVPALQPILDQHIESDGQLLPAVFFYDLATWAEQQPIDSDDLRALLGRCEEAYSGDEDGVRNLLYLGFLGGMAYNSPVYEILGPSLSKDAQDFILPGRGIATSRTTPEEFVRGVVAHIPALQALLDEHLADNDGELLSFAFFPDVAAWAEQQPPESADLRWLLQRCETAYTGLDGRVRNLLYVSFLESLELNSPVLDLLGPALAADADDLRL